LNKGLKQAGYESKESGGINFEYLVPTIYNNTSFNEFTNIDTGTGTNTDTGRNYYPVFRDLLPNVFSYPMFIKYYYICA
jgi:hypothetical protein